MTQADDAESPIDLLVIVIVQDEDAGALSDALNEGGLGHTRMNSAGGFLRASNAMFLIGIDRDRLPELRDLIRATCHTRNEFVTLPWNVDVDYVEPIEVEVGGATLFVLNVESVEQI